MNNLETKLGGVIPIEGKDRRLAERINPDVAFRCRVTHREQEPISALLLDLSRVGAGLLVSGILHSGTEIMLTLPRLGYEMLSIPARVVYCNLEPSGMSVVGCQFITELTQEDLKSILS